MLTFIRTATIAPGKGHEAMSFAHKVAKLVEAKVGAKTNIGMPIGGTFGKIAWVSTYDNMAAFESTATKLLSDTEYTNLVESAAPYFLPGSVRDELWTWTPPEETLRKAA